MNKIQRSYQNEEVSPERPSAGRSSAEFEPQAFPSLSFSFGPVLVSLLRPVGLLLFFCLITFFLFIESEISTLNSLSRVGGIFFFSCWVGLSFFLSCFIVFFSFLFFYSLLRVRLFVLYHGDYVECYNIRIATENERGITTR